MDNVAINYNPSRRALALALGFAIVVGSVIPDLDHIPEALGKSYPPGRFLHTPLLIGALLCIGYCLTRLGGLYFRLVLRR